MRRLSIIIILLMVLSVSAFGWFHPEDDHYKGYIAGAEPDQHLEPDGASHPAGGMVSLPLTIRVFTEKIEYDLQVVKLQWRLDKDPGVENWTTITPTYEDTTRNFEFNWDEYWFGRAPDGTISSDDVTPGDTVLVRLYMANTSVGSQNASLDVDTTADGTNGWQDHWVVAFDTREDDERPPVPFFFW